MAEFVEDDAAHFGGGGGGGEPTQVHGGLVVPDRGVKGIGPEIGPRGAGVEADADGRVGVVVEDKGDSGMGGPFLSVAGDTLVERGVAAQEADMDHALMGGPELAALRNQPPRRVAESQWVSARQVTVYAGGDVGGGHTVSPARSPTCCEPSRHRCDSGRRPRGCNAGCVPCSSPAAAWRRCGRSRGARCRRRWRWAGS